ncbi:glycine oxidase ThiO [Methylobacterium sp. 4-46]|uniref:glycine oxidase ThiO n=1 Tax=unclassified Methylobacterium TaxID=2615210 RepID=UPI000152E98A|nr:MULTISPECIES: glycine oxidase ThiO [Methylobacterium]ACA21016.1 glycine oxidase ThiO [Methylobacterium sp. 4-46]WFT80168.1 glycine oxidase ThiO [Methylobacterium nodulans]
MSSPSPIGRRRAAPGGPEGGPAADPANDRLPERADVAVVGGGLIGLAIGWRLAEAGLAVAVLERGRAGDGASLAATGMLAAAAEHEPGGDALLPLALESQRLWHPFRDALEAASGLAVDYRSEGTLVIALGRDEVERLRFRHDLQRRAGLDVAWLSGPEVRAREPSLRPTVTAGLFCPADHQVDPVRTVAALRRALRGAGGRLVEGCPVLSLEREGGRVTGVITAGGSLRAGTVVLASGAWAGEGSLVPDLALPVRPLRGQSLALRVGPRSGRLDHVVWTEQVHMAPKGDGQLIVGATVEEIGFDASLTAGGLYALLEGARRAFPGIEEMQVENVWSGFRPTSDDDAPILGEARPGLVLAVGHHRNGVLLAPVTASAIAGLIGGGALPPVAAPFGPARFAPRTARLQRLP